MARSVRSKRRLRNQRVQVEKLKVFEKNRLEDIIKKRDEHFDNQIVDAEALNIPPELAALNKTNTDEMQVEKENTKDNKKNNKKVDAMVDDDEESDEEMDDSTKVKKSVNPSHLSNKENKQKYIKLYIKKQKKRAQHKKKVPII
ncbi:hypothetical protein DICPUDRAFT_156946 [Dictyostelium purpureum]|uniref:Uncharacterized protein n=1 Tax=Dictyostelium purpureum TaxID=5786 RepID=F0ZXV2_DICPU|nr:uncharacterized protein DICPUDRAFT_156946 [Dictyostelium purpureum]EGC31215.1 hypothetical protein DICPUDRAFT_156946 [Dictyostelium purpureum]|eukprot:XP_003292245.1 hypothetical protein DICPUDRAFT_156946 [Dictyostelium purpureum]